MKEFSVQDLQIAGVAPFSSVDWPGRLVASIFCQGCPWACPYCHNHAIIDPRIPGVVAWESIENLLNRRRGLLDGVVFSGGEAAMQAALVPAVARVRQLGFDVGLHSAGCYPRRLGELLQSGQISWLGLDIKAFGDADYLVVSGRANAQAKAWESLRIAVGALENGCLADLEVRTTVYPAGPRDVVEVAQRVRQLGGRKFALQIARAKGAPVNFDATGGSLATMKNANSVLAAQDEYAHWWQSAAAQIAQMGWEQFTLRD